ncbi:hypothetical protein K502DRAFT_352695 [Neoconidiobolus thromboides FSU 785]|nr:hypothetical protein K502DRAFT_352695 [Neoconidiobolus thromboides FSU 785]
MELSKFNELPYELVDEVLNYLSETDLLEIRLANKSINQLVNIRIFHTLKYSDNHRYRKELTNKYGNHTRNLALLKLDNLSFDHMNIFNSCPHLNHLQLEETDVNPDVVDFFTNFYPRMKSIKISLLDKGQFSPIHSAWINLKRFQHLNVLHLNYVDYRVAEKVFYSLPLLKDFRCKLITPPAKNVVISSDLSYDELYSIDYDFKLKYKNRYLTSLHLESWAKDIDVDSKLFYLHPDCFPNLINLTLVSYQTKNQSWFLYPWSNLKNVQLDYVRNDEDAENLTMSVSNVESFECMMWSSSGKHLNQFIFQLPKLHTLKIEGSISQEVLMEVNKTEKIKKLSIGVVNFDASTLQLLNSIFPSGEYVQLGHCKAQQELADSISSLNIKLNWSYLKVFQLSATVAAIASKAPKLKELYYDVPTRLYSPLKVTKLLKQSNPIAVKVLKSLEI